MRSTLSVVAVVAGLLALVPMQAGAHHAFSAEFDGNKPVLLKGVVTKMDWVNPHAWLHIEVKKPDGTIEKWMIEGGTPNTLVRRGLKKADVPAGIEVIVDGYRAKDGGLRANGKNITLPDGRQLFLGSSGTGAPLDPRDLTDTQKK